MTAINKIFATREELIAWNKALDDMARGTFAPEILEMISDAEKDYRSRWDSRVDTHEDYLATSEQHARNVLNGDV